MNKQCDSCSCKDLIKELNLAPFNYKMIEVSVVCKGCGVFQKNSTYYKTKKG